MERPHKRHHLIQPPCAHCGEAVLTTAWNVPVFCHDDCADGLARGAGG